MDNQQLRGKVLLLWLQGMDYFSVLLVMKVNFVSSVPLIFFVLLIEKSGRGNGKGYSPFEWHDSIMC